MKRRKVNRGFTLVEVATSAVIFSGIIITVCFYLIDSLKTQKIVNAKFDMQRDTRSQTDAISRDITAAYAVLPTYTSGTKVYKSDGTSTLILSLPSQDAAGSATGLTDTVIYTMATGAAANNLQRLTFPSASSIRAAGSVTVAKNISSLSITYYVHDKLTGNGSTTTFNLQAKPWNSDVTLSVNGTESKPSNTQGGFSVSSTGTLTKSPALLATDAAEAVYAVDPAVDSASVGEIVFGIKTIQSTYQLGGNIPAQTYQAETRTLLRNH